MAGNDLTKHDREWIAACNAAAEQLRTDGVFEDREYHGAVVVTAAIDVAENKLTAKQRGQRRRQAELEASRHRKPVGTFSGNMARGLSDRGHAGQRSPSSAPQPRGMSDVNPYSGDPFKR